MLKFGPKPMDNIRYLPMRNQLSLTASLFALMCMLPVWADDNYQTLNTLELSGVVMNQPNSVAVFFNKQNKTEIVLREGDIVSDCVVDDIRRNQVYFYCKDQQIHTLNLRGVDEKNKNLATKAIWSNQVAISSEEELFSTASHFADQFALTP